MASLKLEKHITNTLTTPIIFSLTKHYLLMAFFIAQMTLSVEAKEVCTVELVNAADKVFWSGFNSGPQCQEPGEFLKDRYIQDECSSYSLSINKVTDGWTVTGTVSYLPACFDPGSSEPIDHFYIACGEVTPVEKCVEVLECPSVYEQSVENCANDGGELHNWQCTERNTDADPLNYSSDCKIPECPAAYNAALSSCSNQGGQLQNWSCSEDPLNYSSQCELPSDVDLDKNKGPDCDDEGNPCSPSSGNKYESFVDYQSADGKLSVNRNYNSLNPRNSSFGIGWTSNSLASLSITDTEIAINSSTGRTEKWVVDYIGLEIEGMPIEIISNENTTLIPPPDTQLILRILPDGYSLKNTDNSVDRFNASGDLISSQGTDGLVTNYSYGSNERISIVTDPYGRTLTYTYVGKEDFISTITTPDGVLSYAYDDSGNLTQITYSDGSTEIYHYENANYPHALTGITDENGVRFATWTYTEDGKAASSEHVGEVEKVTFTYETNDSNDVTETTVAGALGDIRTYNFDLIHGVYKVTSITGDQCTNCGNGYMKSRDYDDNGFLAGYIDWEGNETRFENNARGLVTLKTEYEGNGNSALEIRKTYYVWHENLRLPLQIIEPKRKTQYTYTPGGKVLTHSVTEQAENRIIVITPGETGVISNEARTTTYTYHPVGTNGAGLVASIDSPRTDVNDLKSFTYNTKGELVNIINALGHSTSIASHDPSGRPLTFTDANGVGSTLSWDLRGRLTQMIIDGKATDYTYDAVGQLTRVTEADGSFLNYEYDAAHRLVNISDNLGNKIAYKLDAMGNRISTENSDANNLISFNQSAVYDKLSRLRQSLGANGQQQENSYDENHNLVNSIDSLSRETQNTYDALDRLTKSINPDAKETNLEYDKQDNLTKVKDARGLETTYIYNGYDEVISQTSPDTGTTTYTYDDAGNLSSMTDARGIIVNYTYGALNRITKADYVDDSQDVTYTYDIGTNSKGRLTTRQDASGNSSYSYDARGNLISETIQIQEQTYTTEYRYNDANRLIGTIYPDGLIVDHQLDTIGRVSAIDAIIDSESQSVVNNVRYLPFGPINSLTYGNGLIESRNHDSSYRLNQLAVGDALSTTQYTYNTVDNITAINKAQDAANDQSFFYDVLDRVINETGSYGERSYQYDAVSNRTQRIKNFEKLNDAGVLVPKITTQNYTLDESSHRLNSINNKSITYDPMGNTLSINNNKKEFTYNEAGRMQSFTKASVLKAEYLYNGMGQRTVKIRHKGDGTKRTFHYHYDQNGQLLAETKYDKLDRKRLSREYIWLNDKPVMQLKTRYKANGQLKDRAIAYIHTDHLNAPTKATNDTQLVVWEWNHEAFGAGSPDRDPDADETKTNIPLRFSGQYKDGESGLFYNYYRYYNPQTGRYVTSDPIGLAGGINTYGYVEGNPLMYTDPLGLKVLLCKQPAFGIPYNPLKHYWIKTDTIEAGMGPINGNGNAGNQSGDFPGDPVEVTNHQGRYKEKTASCEVVKDVDENKVNSLLEIGRDLGNWWPNNQCQSFVIGVLNQSRINQPKIPNDNLIWITP